MIFKFCDFNFYQENRSGTSLHKREQLTFWTKAAKGMCEIIHLDEFNSFCLKN